MSELNDEERMMLEQIGRFAKQELEPYAPSLDEGEETATRHLKHMAALGLMGLNISRNHGGIGLSGIALYEAVELIAGACGSTASMLTAHFLATDSVDIGGSEEQRDRILPLAASGEMLGAFALTEPHAGSNPVDMGTTAVKSERGYHIRGTKCFISNAAYADFIIIYAKTAPELGARGISAFLVEPKEVSGIEFGLPERTMGLRGGHVFTVTLDCVVPLSSLMGTEGSGFRTALSVLDNGRIEVAAQATGVAAAALEAAIAYSKERKVGGHPVADFQGIQWMLADCAVDLSAARALGKSAAGMRGTGKRYSTEAAMAKLFATEAAGRIADKALQIHGGNGYTRDYPLERYVRDLRILRIYEGSSEIQRGLIARTLLRDR
ncbi:acyl-CoA dehydrogenase family protein [Rhizobium sp. 42MFCr.1]|uniref:acyl-CoA dehydrogenase family protein n=1 Tax=Rhizobium sp. 42MFCr.1 TaxID=1048680 RepID=UPI00036F1F92|nr:acyl-CoA dehydrogenase family protein [Rhizobium sp. 42MFCr.1]